MAIETGIQNFGVAFLVMYMNLPSPEADLSLLPLIVVAMLTNLPLFCIYLSLKFYDFIKARFFKSKTINQKESVVEKSEAKPMIEKSETLLTNLDCWNRKNAIEQNENKIKLWIIIAMNSKIGEWFLSFYSQAQPRVSPVTVL